MFRAVHVAQFARAVEEIGDAVREANGRLAEGARLQLYRKFIKDPLPTRPFLIGVYEFPLYKCNVLPWCFLTALLLAELWLIRLLVIGE